MSYRSARQYSEIYLGDAVNTDENDDNDNDQAEEHIDDDGGGDDGHADDGLQSEKPFLSGPGSL